MSNTDKLREIADKMVSERLREALIAYTRYGQQMKWVIKSIVNPEIWVNKYLKDR